MKYLLLLSIIFSFLQSEDYFETRQKTLQDIKNIVQYEESLARTYEQYILEKYKFPSSISDLTTLVGGNISSFVSTVGSGVNTTVLTSGLPKINYALASTLSSDNSIKSLYESDTFRKRTYVQGGEIYFMLEDSFAKHLFDLIKYNSEEIKTCSSTNTNKVCMKDNHIYVSPVFTLTEITSYLMCYKVDKFKSGPIIVTSDTSKHISESIFTTIPKGALIYDVNGVKYVKTLTSVEVLK